MSEFDAEKHAYDEELRQSLAEWELVTYPRKWNAAFAVGKKAREDNLPNVCNLGSEFRNNGIILKEWLNAWKCGYGSSH